MTLDDAEVAEFAACWQEEFHETIPLDEARRSASLLLDLVWLLVQPAPATSAQAEEEQQLDDTSP